MQNIAQMGTVGLYVSLGCSSCLCVRTMCCMSVIFPSVSHVELIGAVLHTSVSGAVRFFFYICQVFHDISQMIMSIKTIMANRI